LANVPTESFGGVEGFSNQFIETQVKNTRNSALDYQNLVTVNTTLEANPGDVYHVDRIIPAGEAEIVAEGAGNKNKITTSTEQSDYTVATAQAWFQYTDERLRRTPDSVAAGIANLGVTLTNKMNLDIVGELAKSTTKQTSKSLDFDSIVDAQNLLDLDTFTEVGVAEGQSTEQVVADGTILLVGKVLRAAIRKACKDELKYVESFVRQGYIGTIAGTNVFYSKLMDATTYNSQAFLFNKQAVTVFMKSTPEIEAYQKGNRAASDANTRTNNVFARQTYVTALTDATKAAVITIGAGA
jgi:hypothetical protein